MFTAALFTIANIEKQAKCLSMDDWVKMKYDSYTMEYDSAMRKNILPLVTTRMGTEGIMLSEIQRKTNTVCNHLYVDSKKAKCRETETRVERVGEKESRC